MRRIGGRLRSGYSGSCGVVVEIPPFAYLRSNSAIVEDNSWRVV